MENRNRKVALWTLLILTLVFVLGLYGRVLWSPNHYLFTASGDGIKNYYTWVWHLKNDTSVLNFEGMNYPYGQHFMYTDCHPLLYFVVKPLSLVFPGILDYSIGILNLFMLLSFFLTPLFLWLIFIELKTKPFLAALGAFGISLLAPQVFRLTGHLSLSYSFFIPLSLWLILKCWKAPQHNYKWDFLLLINGLFWFFIHPYLGMMSTALLLVFWLFHLIQSWQMERGSFRTYLRLFITALLPVLIFLAFVKLSDDRTGRSDHPLGFFLYNAEPDDVFVPLYPPLRPLIDQVVEVRQQWEGWSYVGILSIGILIFVFIRAGKNFIQKKKFVFDKKYLPQGDFRLILWASVILLFFSFGWPFKLFPESIDYFPLVRQFRATGRFAWFFFFAVNILSVVVVDNLWKIDALKTKRKVILAIYFVLLCFPMLEGLPYHLDISRQISQQTNVFHLSNINSEDKEVIHQINPDDYQAIIPLPFYYNGSENFSIPVRGEAMAVSTMISYHSNLPVLGGSLARTGIDESRRIIQVLSPGFYPKKIKEDLKSEKAFLVVVAKGELSVYEKELLEKCVFLARTSDFELYRLDKDRLFESTAIRELNHFIHNDSLTAWKGFLVSDTTSVIYFNAFNSQKALHSLGGSGAFSGKKKEHLTVAEFGAGIFVQGDTYTLSAWFYNGGQDAVNNWFRLMKEEYDPRADEWIESWALPENSEVIDGDWSLVELDFQVKDAGNEVAFKTLGKAFDKQPFFLDDVLIHRKDVDVYKILKDENGRIITLFKNNHRIDVKR